MERTHECSTVFHSNPLATRYTLRDAGNMANVEEAENVDGRRVFINCVDSYQGRNIAKVGAIKIIIRSYLRSPILGLLQCLLLLLH